MAGEKWRLALVALVVVLSLPGGCGDGPEEIVCEGKVVPGEDGRQRCVFDGPNRAPASDTGPSPDTPRASADAAPDPGGTPDTQAIDDTGPDAEPSCEEAEVGAKPMGHACERHCECDTGYCYDEAYLGDFRFCTRECETSCSDEGQDPQKFTCLQLGGGLAAAHGLERPRICQPVCSDLADCEELGAEYDTCGSTSCFPQAITCWGDKTVALRPTCQIRALVE